MHPYILDTLAELARCLRLGEEGGGEGGKVGERAVGEPKGFVGCDGKREHGGPGVVLLLAYRPRCEPATAAHFFHLLDAAFERRRVSWGPLPSGARAPADTTLYELFPKAHPPLTPTTGPKGTACGYCAMLLKQRRRRHAAQ